MFSFSPRFFRCVWRSGVVVAEVAFSPRLFFFALFMFLSLSAAKRQTEITRMMAHWAEGNSGQGLYRASDAPLILSLGVGSMMATVLIIAVYLVEVRYSDRLLQAPALFMELSR